MLARRDLERISNGSGWQEREAAMMCSTAHGKAMETVPA
jgi:hypothetical protein